MRAPIRPPTLVRERGDGRINDRCTGEPGLERRNRGAMQPVRDLQVTGPQVGSLVDVGRIAPYQPQGQYRLDGQYGYQQQAGR